MLAVLRNDLESVGWLASIDLACMKLQNKDELSVLHVAAANGKTEIASVLLKSVNSSDKSSLISSMTKACQFSTCRVQKVISSSANGC